MSSGGTGTTPEGKEINDLKTVDYSAMSALYVEAIKELTNRLKDVERELAALKDCPNVNFLSYLLKP